MEYKRMKGPMANLISGSTRGCLGIIIFIIALVGFAIITNLFADKPL